MAKYYYGNGNLLVDGTYFLTNFVCFISTIFCCTSVFDINKLYKTLIGFFISVCIFVMTRYFMQEFMMPLFFGIRKLC